MQTFVGLTLALGLAVATPPAAADAASPWLDLQDAKLRLLSASDGLDAAGAATLGLQIRLAPGWKTYWREPGEAGLPPRLDLTKAENVAAATLAFPVPHRFVAFGFTQLGYAEEVVLPIRLRAADPARPVTGTLAVDFMYCEQICVPGRGEFALDLPPARPTATEHAALIAGYAKRVPPPAGAAHLRIQRAALDAKRLRVEAVADRPFLAPDLFVEAGGRVGFGAPAVSLSEDGRRAVLTLPVSGADLAGRDVRLTLVDGDRAVEQTVTVSK